MSVNLPNLEWKHEVVEASSDLRKGILNGLPTVANASFVQIVNDDESLNSLAPLHQDMIYLYFDEAHRNDYSNYPTPQELRAKQVENHNTRLSSGIPSNNKCEEWLAPFMQTLAYKRSHELLESWMKINPISGGVLPSHAIAEYIPKPIPRDIREMLNHPRLHFEQLQQILEPPDEESGFYQYKGLLVMCKHFYMFYSGENGREIYRECGDGSGVCRYCGASLPIDIYDNNDQLETHHLAIIFTFIDSLGTTVDPTVVLRILTAAVSKSIDKLKLSVDNEICGFITCYLFKLDRALAEFDSKRYNRAELEKLYSEEWSLNKWKREDVEKTIENDDLFCDFLYVLNYLKSLLERSSTREVTSAVDVLYANANSPLIQLYEKDPTIFSSMNEVIRLKSLDVVGTNSACPTKFAVTQPVHLSIVGTSKLIDYIRKWGELVCPAGGLHSLPCKCCGLKKDLSNAEEVAAKFEKSMVRSTGESLWHKLDQASERSKFIEKIAKRSTEKPSKLSDIDILLSDDHRKQVRELLIQLIGIGEIPELTASQADICRMLNFIISTNIVDYDWLINQLQSIYQTVPPITFAKLFTSM